MLGAIKNTFLLSVILCERISFRGLMKATELLALNLRRLRIPRGWSQEDLALEAEVARTYLSKLERALDNPSLAVVEKLAGALGVHISELLAPINRIEDIPERSKGGRPRTRPLKPPKAVMAKGVAKARATKKA